MSYAEDYDDYEQDAQGQECETNSDHSRMCSYFELSNSEFLDLSVREKANIRWNWKNIQNRGKVKS